MPETSTPENEAAVARVYGAALSALQRGEPITDEERLVHDVEHFMQEVNSGASFEQYFRWASLSEIAGLVAHLRGLGLDDVAALVERALAVAFPRGLPASEDEKSDATEWTPEQEEALGALFPELEQRNGRVMNVLGRYAANVR